MEFTQRRVGRIVSTVLAIALCQPCLGLAEQESFASHAMTQSGPLKGFRENGVDKFLGVPYAAAPIGKLRFQAPIPPTPWVAAKDASEFGPPCPQDGKLGTPSTNEDCLTLNVYRPLQGGPHRPFLVFFFGGSFKHGSAGTGKSPYGPNYDGTQIAKQTGSIVVTVNYRLGVLGFLALPALDAENPQHVSGNYGLLDQQAALRWIQMNARLLGGDAERVTVFGQSAGAVSILEHLTSPTAAGLFASAELESPGALPRATLSHLEHLDEPLLAATGCDTGSDATTCLRELPVQTLIASNVPVGPNIDGVVIPQDPNTAFSSGAFAHVPIIVGTDADEGTFFIAAAAKHAAVSADVLERTLASTFGANAAHQIEAQYPIDNYGSPGQALSAVLTDEFFACPTATLTSGIRSEVPVLQFEFSQPDPVHNFPVPVVTGIETRDTHTSELAYIFGHDGAGTLLPVGPSRTLSDLMIEGLGVLAQSRPPLRVWDREMTGQVIELTTPVRESFDFFARHQCHFWQALGVKPALIEHLN